MLELRGLGKRVKPWLLEWMERAGEWMYWEAEELLEPGLVLEPGLGLIWEPGLGLILEPGLGLIFEPWLGSGTKRRSGWVKSRGNGFIILKLKDYVKCLHV